MSKHHHQSSLMQFMAKRPKQGLGGDTSTTNNTTCTNTTTVTTVTSVRSPHTVNTASCTNDNSLVGCTNSNTNTTSTTSSTESLATLTDSGEHSRLLQDTLPSPSSSSFPSTSCTTSTISAVDSQPTNIPPSDIAGNKGESPRQPTGIQFPSRAYGSSNRSFQPNWYKEFEWLEYSIERDAVFCFPCRFFGIAPDKAFISTGFRDWKHARGKSGILTTHENSWKEYRSTVVNNSSISVQLETRRLRTIEDNRLYVRSILESILFCCQQGIALRGHREVIDSIEETAGNVGNFRALMILLSRNNDIIRQKLTSGPKNATWLGHDIQNSLIALLANSVRTIIKREVQSAQFYTLMADETKDVSKSEQLSLVLRYLYNGITHERFISFTKCDELNSEALFSYIMKGLQHLDINISNCVSQCYDGASVMSGCNSGVRKRVTEINPKSVYIHCHAHQLNLVLVDTCKTLNHASEFFSLLQSLYNFISSSIPHAVFMSKQQELGLNVVQLKKLSDTRWSCRYTSIKSVLSSISAVIATLEEIGDACHNERAIEARGLLHQIKSFPFLLSLVLLEKIFSITHNLSQLLQSEVLHYAAAAASCIKATKTTLNNLKSDEEWKTVWEVSVALAEKFDISVTPPRSGRTRRVPRHLEESFIVTTNTTTTADLPCEEYRTGVFFATIDVLITELNDRFSELNLSLLCSLEALTPTSAEFLHPSAIKPFLHYELSEDSFVSEATTARVYLQQQGVTNQEYQSDTFHKIYNHLSQVAGCFPTIITCYQIALTIGVSTASAERSFSSLRRIKTYLRSTMKEDRLSNLALLYIERDLSSKLWNEIDRLVIEFAQQHGNSKIALL